MRLIATATVLVALCLGFASTSWAQTTPAQPGDAARSASARALFEEGVQFADTGKWPEAEDRFRRALTLRDSQVIRYNLASALCELGRVVECSELLRQVVASADADNDLRSDAGSKLDAANARIAKLTVTIEGEQTGIDVHVGELVLDPAQLGVPVPIDPGLYRVRALRGEAEVAFQDVDLGSGAAQTITLTTAQVATPAEAAATVVVAPSPIGPSRQDQADKRRSRLMWIGIGAGVAVTVAVAVITSITLAGNSDSDPSPTGGDFDPMSVRVKVSP